MGLTDFSLCNLFFSFTAQGRAALGVQPRDLCRPPVRAQTSVMSVAAIVLATELGRPAAARHRRASTWQWIVCILVARSVIVVTEIYKAVLRRKVRGPLPPPRPRPPQ